MGLLSVVMWEVEVIVERKEILDETEQKGFRVGGDNKYENLQSS